MIPFDVNAARETIKLIMPNVDLDSQFEFYYDETNNMRKFYLREEGFNYSFDSNFVLGGVVFKGDKPNLEELYSRLNLQKSITEVKLKHIAKGDFLDCLKSQKLSVFLQYLIDSKLFIHYSTVNVLYFSIVDIVDSAIVNSGVSMQLGQDFSLMLKNDLYKLCKLEIESVVDLFNRYKYPNIKKEAILSFVADLISLFESYENLQEFHLGLTSLKQILKESEKSKSLPFIMDEEDYILLKDFSHFYLRPIYTFKFSNHIFDNEETIMEILDNFELIDNGKVIKPYHFEDSVGNLLIQTSDVFIGLVGKLSKFINISSIHEISNLPTILNETQRKNLTLYFDLIDKSEKENVLFLHNITSIDDMEKTRILYEVNKIGIES